MIKSMVGVLIVEKEESFSLRMENYLQIMTGVMVEVLMAIHIGLGNLKKVTQLIVGLVAF